MSTLGIIGGSGLDDPALRVDDLVAVFNANVDCVTRVLLCLCRDLAD